MFNQLLAELINLKHPRVKLADVMDWVDRERLRFPLCEYNRPACLISKIGGVSALFAAGL